MRKRFEGREFEYIFSKDAEITLWGAANIGCRFVDFYSRYLNITKICDGNSDVVGTQVRNFTVRSTDEIVLQKNQIVIVSCSYYAQIRPILEERGFVHNLDMFYYDDVEKIIACYKHGYLRSDRVDISLTEQCTFRCRKCNMFMPFFENPKHQPLQDVIDDIDAYFELVDYVREMELLGGEPFLYPHLEEVIRYIGEVYRDRIKYPTFYTNGTIVPSDRILKKMKEYDFQVMLSDYRAAIPYEKRWAEVRDTLDQYEIYHFAPDVEQWKDFGFPDNIPDMCAEGDFEERFQDCMPPFRGLYKKRIAFCHLEMSAWRAGIYPYVEKDYYNLAEDISDRKARFLEFDMGYITGGALDFCKVCRGCGKNNTLIVKTAEQMPQKNK